ncbi:MAG: nitroreductase family protein [Clostridia bacterium]
MFIICYDKNVSWKSKFDNRDEGVVDASIVATHMMFEIQDLGLGTTWIGYFDSQKVREIYKIPQNYEIVALMPVGYPANDSKPSEAHYKRNNIENMVFWEEIK